MTQSDGTVRKYSGTVSGDAASLSHLGNAEEYEGILGFRHAILPELIRQGYDQSNPNHTSSFWFHLAKGDPMAAEHSYVLHMDSYDGLSIDRTEVEGITIFTEMDVQRFLDLKMQK